jgi:predicted nucleotidyltransferase
MDDQFINSLPPNAGRVLAEFIEQARSAFADDLRAIVLYGSGAEGKLRATSDVNLLLVLSAFDREKADQLRDRVGLDLFTTSLERKRQGRLRKTQNHCSSPRKR